VAPLADPPAIATPPGLPVARVPVALMAAAIGLAFADSSIVVLALPDVYRTFDVSLVDVSWVITSYNLAVVAAACVLLLVKASGRRVTGVGLVIFAVASVVCGVAPSFDVLVAARSAQGVGAACVLVGSLPLLVALTGSAAKARSVWGYAGAVGVAVGPALGGVLTEAVTWRSIFLVQAPVAALALAGTARKAEADRESRPGRIGVAAVAADLGFVLLFAALVGALFLSVLLLIVVWDYSPLQSALVVSALAAGTVAVGPLGRALPQWIAALGGGWMLAGGLVGLAWLPATEAGYAVAALAFCGCGFGLVNGVLGRRSLPPGDGLRRPGNLVIGAKHVGFVVGLIAIAPMLATDIAGATREATIAATATVLDAPLRLGLKVPLALELKKLVETTPRGEVPDVGAAFDRLDAGDSESVTAVRDDLTGAIEGTITRSFRASFLLAALFAAAATVVGVMVALLPRPDARDDDG
jgi:MFS family permease